MTRLAARDIARAEKAARGSKLKHFAAALGVGLDEALPYWAAAQRIRGKREERERRRPGLDPLIRAAQSRPERTPTALAQVRARVAAIEADLQAERERLERVAAAARRRRETLLRAARIARSLGWDVRSSTDRAGRVSSYYCYPSIDWRGPPIRISDHEIPWTEMREQRAQMAGSSFGYDGYRGLDLVIDRPRSRTWLRRALMLAAAGRDVPGIDL